MPLCRNQLEPHKQLENAASPTRRVHAVLGSHLMVTLGSISTNSKHLCGINQLLPII